MMVQIASLIGSILVLSAYFLASTDRIPHNGKTHTTLNVIGSLILLGVSVEINNYGFFLMNFVWLFVALLSDKTVRGNVGRL